MKVTFSAGRSIIEADGKDVKECFSQLAQAAEVFGIQQCGACESRDVLPVTRSNKGYDFYEMKCTACGASLSMGQKRSDGSLFPKVKEGWKRWANTDPSSDSDDSPF